MILVTYHHDGVVALCDADLLGKEFEEGKMFLQVTKRFYGGNKVSLKEVKEILHDARSLNLVGQKIIGIALKEGFIIEKDVLIIQGVPHVQIYKG